MTTNILALLPILIPLFSGIIMLFMGKRTVRHRVVSGITALLMMLAAAFIVAHVFQHGTMVSYIGNWMAPFGINLVIDMASALLLLTTSVITFAVIVYSFQSIGIEREKYYYYVMVM